MLLFKKNLSNLLNEIYFLIHKSKVLCLKFFDYQFLRVNAISWPLCLEGAMSWKIHPQEADHYGSHRGQLRGHPLRKMDHAILLLYSIHDWIPLPYIEKTAVREKNLIFFLHKALAVYGLSMGLLLLSH